MRHRKTVARDLSGRVDLIALVSCHTEVVRLAMPLTVCLILGAVFFWVLPSAKAPQTPTRWGPVAAALNTLHRLPDAESAGARARALLERHFEELPATRIELSEAWANPSVGVRWGGWLSADAYGVPDAVFWRSAGTGLMDSDPRVQTAACQAITAVGEAPPVHVLDLLRAASASSAASVRRAAIYGLYSSSWDTALWPLLIERLSDPDAACREAAARAFARVAFSNARDDRVVAPVREALTAAATDSREGVRMYVAMALGRMDERAAPAVKTLVALLQDESMLVQGHAATALGRVGPAALESLVAVLPVVRDEQAPMVIWGLRMMGTVAVPHLLRIANDDKRPAVRVMAAAKLWELRHPIDDLLPVFTKALAGDDRNAQLHAARAIERIGVPAARSEKALSSALDRVKISDEKKTTLQRALTAALRRVRDQ